MNFRKALGLVLVLLSLFPLLGLSQPRSELAPPPDLAPAEGEQVAKDLLDNLLAQKPEQDSATHGVLKIRDAEGRTREIPAIFEILSHPTNWVNTYTAAAAGNSPGQKLTITHTPDQPNQYLLSQLSKTGTVEGSPRQLSGNELMTPFAGSDFWVVDLGLEFLHWPNQRVLRKQMRKGLMCDVLQSVNPARTPVGYSKVWSWIAINRPDDIVIVHAEAFDARGKLLKEFDPKKVEKVNGAWQLSEMEIRNRQTGSRTKIDFDVGTK